MSQHKSSERSEGSGFDVERIAPRLVAGAEAGTVDHDDRLIRWMLELSPLRRLEALQEFVDGLTALRHARKIAR